MGGRNEKKHLSPTTELLFQPGIYIIQEVYWRFAGLIMRRWKQALILLLLLTVYTLAEAALVRATSDELEQDVYRLVNEHRASLGLKPLTFNP